MCRILFLETIHIICTFVQTADKGETTIQRVFQSIISKIRRSLKKRGFKYSAIGQNEQDIKPFYCCWIDMAFIMTKCICVKRAKDELTSVNWFFACYTYCILQGFFKFNWDSSFNQTSYENQILKTQLKIKCFNCHTKILFLLVYW